MLEQFQNGRSRSWYWRQVLYVVLVGAWGGLKEQFSIIAIGALFSSAIALMTYITVQQIYRRSGDEPQIHLAEQAASSLGHGADISGAVPRQTIDMKTSLAPYVIVFDERGVPLRSSVSLNGHSPVPPPGVFEFARRNAIEHRFTWEPAQGVRSAVVLRHFDGKNAAGFVLVGRSLREVETRVSQMTRMVMLTWAGSLMCLLAYFVFGRAREARA